MNSMLMLYMAPIPSTNVLRWVESEKEQSKTWPEHYHYLVYAVERSGDSE